MASGTGDRWGNLGQPKLRPFYGCHIVALLEVIRWNGSGFLAKCSLLFHGLEHLDLHHAFDGFGLGRVGSHLSVVTFATDLVALTGFLDHEV